MAQGQLLLVLLLACLFLCSAFAPSRHALKAQSQQFFTKTTVAKTAVANVLAGASLALTPWPVLADDQNAFVVPLAVSLFTMVPFLYYQQALKPKPRTVQQIELDENLKPVKGKSVGAAGQAKAGKKTK